jgi:membrane-bound lytic murein transglycosylase B
MVLRSLRPSSTRHSFARLAGAALMTLATVAAPLADTAGFVAGLWPQASAQGVSRQVFEAAFAGYAPSSEIMALTRKQPEFTQTVADYIAKRVTPGQVQKGRAMQAKWHEVLADISSRYGVQGEVLLAIWGMETNFGGYMGNTNTIHALATLTQNGYRDEFFRKELLTALKILQQGHIPPNRMVGSWAGAMGHTQFMPSSFMAYAVDYTGDGTKDIWRAVSDALASSANYLNSHGWRAGETWGYEVDLPAGFDFARAEGLGKLPLGEWRKLGITRTGGREFPRAGDMASLYMPAGGDGPAFLLLPNFEVIKRYNNSNSYALAVGHLADRILGAPDFVTPWPANDFALNQSQRVEVQHLLARRGYDPGKADGDIGPRTRAAIRAFQAATGMTADGHASGRLLRALQ